MGHATDTHCKHGHAYGVNNFYIYAGTRVCKLCKKINNDNWEEKSQRNRKRRKKQLIPYAGKEIRP